MVTYGDYKDYKALLSAWHACSIWQFDYNNKAKAHDYGWDINLLLASEVEHQARGLDIFWGQKHEPKLWQNCHSPFITVFNDLSSR